MVGNVNGAGNGGRRSNRSRGSRGGKDVHHQSYCYRQQNFPKLPDRARDDVSSEERPLTPAEGPGTYQDEGPAESPSPGDGRHSISLIWNGVPADFKMDQSQLFVLAGPFEVNGSESYEAHPVPKGATVFATPSMAPHYWPTGHDMVINFRGNSPLNTANGFNPDPAARQTAIDETDKEDDDDASEYSNEERGTHHPSMTVFNAAFPKGKAFLLRQPQPPVYFQHPNGAHPGMVDHRCNGESVDRVGQENRTSSQAEDEEPAPERLSVEV